MISIYFLRAMLGQSSILYLNNRNNSAQNVFLYNIYLKSLIADYQTK